MIYKELAKKNLRNMEKIIIIGTIGATICYIAAGVFGYVTFIGDKNIDDIMEK